ncbi:unnamed protein product [Somion occarium]|uniref:Nuclear pore complex protein NUP96 C-terminal domain-containing protein n=1 Tax=Somion occarium TaxID=3059160 RepID=A0ABP1CUD1_9APHY
MARFRAPSVDSEDDDQMSSSEQQQSEGSEYVPSHHEDEEYVSEEYEETSEEDEDTSVTPPPVDEKRVDASVIPWAREIGVEPQRMHVMQSTLFRLPEEAAAFKERFRGRWSSRRVATGRASFAANVEPQPFKPTRKYARVDSSASAVRGNESLLVDAGLAMGRSFRVGWGPGGKIVHVGALCGVSSKSKSSANSSVVHITTVPVFSTSEKEASERASRLLSCNLQHSPIEHDADGVPCANPSKDLSFSSFASLFPSNDRSFEANLFRLGQALFDHLELSVPDALGADIRAKIAIMRRRRAFSDCLQSAVASSVDSDVRGRAAEDWAATVYAFLTGNQLDKACDAAIDAGNVKLATLLSQVPGDQEFREDLRMQLALWQEQRIDAHIDVNVRRIYALLAGVVDILEGSKGTGPERCPDLSLAADLDWKRAFGLHLWFGQRMDTPIADAFTSYCRASEDTSTNTSQPIPWYRESSASDESEFLWKLPQDSHPPDALFSLIRLFSEPSCSLSDILTPLSFSSSPVDYRLPWHLYIVLSRCLRVRDFADRGEPVVDSLPNDETDNEPRVEGHSPSADLLANSYAHQLEKVGLIQEAVFVLLHIEGSAGRRRAIKDLLSRSASRLDDYMTRGLVGSLKIPLTWVNEAKATYALSEGAVYRAYELYLSAEMYNAAHNIAVLELAPDAVIREDLELLTNLFQKFVGQPVDDWNLRGKLFLDYVHAMTRLPKLREHIIQIDAVPDASQATELEELSRSVPKLISLLPDVLPDHNNLRYKAALSEMITGLTLQLDQVRPLAIQSQLRAPLTTEATRLRHIHATAYERFLRTIQVA